MRSTIIATAFIASALADYSITPEKYAAECNAAHDACVTKPEANMAECASEYAACLGYNPFDGEHDHEEEPTKCSTKPIITPTRPPPPPPKIDCRHVKECMEDVDKCRGKPGANQAECSSEYAKCLGFNPFSPEGEKWLKECEEEKHKPHHNQTGPPPPPVHPTHPPVVVSGGSGMKPWDFFSFLAAGFAALL